MKVNKEEEKSPPEKETKRKASSPVSVLHQQLEFLQSGAHGRLWMHHPCSIHSRSSRGSQVLTSAAA